jgi:zinc/manganese transport system permease protein
MVEISLSVILAVIFAWAGLAAGYFTPYPVSFFITSFAFGFYVLVRLANVLRRVPTLSPQVNSMEGNK